MRVPAATLSNILDTDYYFQQGEHVASELNLGATLRGIRSSRRLSLAEVAEATKISPSFLSLV